MFSGNVMSFMRKIAPPDSGTTGSVTPEEGGTAFSKLRQLGTGLINATGNVTNKLGSGKPVAEIIQPKEEITPEIIKPKSEMGVKVSTGEECRVCRKSFAVDEVSKTCCECRQRVCEDCASYSTTTNSDDPSSWRCSVCRRKLASRDQPIVAQESTDSLLEIPMVEALQRRHSEARLGSQSGTHIGTLGTGLAPPRSPELRRHSDVSPASLKELERFVALLKAVGVSDNATKLENGPSIRKEADSILSQFIEKRFSCLAAEESENTVLLETTAETKESRMKLKSEQTASAEFRKVAGERREEQRRGSELERKSKSRATSPDRHPVERGRVGSSSQKVGMETSPIPDRKGSVRHKTRMTRQTSYDDEMKTVGVMPGGGQHVHPEPGLGFPVQLPRRASAYDVYAVPGSGGLNAMAIAAAQQRASISAQAMQSEDEKRRGEVRQVRAPGGRTFVLGDRKPPEERPTVRRSSFRIVNDVQSDVPVESTIVPVGMPSAVVSPVVMAPGEERPTRRRGSQLPDINTVIALASQAQAGGKVVPQPAVNRVAAEDRELPRQGSLVDGESIKIVIHHADNDTIPPPAFAPPRENAWRVKLWKDPNLEKGYRSDGYGLRVVGGKTGADGRTFAYIVWVDPDGPAAKAGLQCGDKVLKWAGVSLVDRSFEEVAQIIERPDKRPIIELIVEHAFDMIGDLPDDMGSMQQPGKVPLNLGLLKESETDKAPSSPTRRKLPKTPEQIAKEKQVAGRVQIQVSYEADRKELIVSVFTADLCLRDDSTYGKLPEAYAKLILVPANGDHTSLKTIVAEPSQKPIWNDTLDFSGVDGEMLLNSAIEVTLWDVYPDGDVFLGECAIDLQRALENDRAVWYRLEDPRGLRSGKSPYCSPRGSFSMEIAHRLLRKTESRERSYSDDTQSDSGSPELGFLHPDHAWHANSRRGSSQSEQLEVEPYELNRNFSRSLPASRRSSVQSQGGTDSKRGSMGEADVSAFAHHNRERRRSSFTRPMRAPDEILEGLLSLKAANSELGRTMSLSGDKRRESRRGERKESVMDIPEKFRDRNSESDDEDKWSQPTRDENGVDIKLGRGQVSPKGVKMGSVPSGEVKLGFCLSKGTLEVEVICARDICAREKDEPDTYVKSYLRDGDRWLQKRKTRVIRHSRNPQYRQTIKYSSCDALGRNLLVMLWQKKQGFESNQGLGGAEVDLEQLPLTRLTVDWYPLFPIHTLGTQTADSP